MHKNWGVTEGREYTNIFLRAEQFRRVSAIE